ncbi:protein kinase [bacterium]|nr:protein kinase [bacterium]
MLKEGTVLQGYRIEGILGQGGMGTIYKARQTGGQGKQVVLRAIELTANEPELRAMHKTLIVRHGRLLASLNLPGVARVLECFQVDEKHFIAHEYVEGRSLEKVSQAGPAELDQVFDWADQLCDTLHKLHQHDPPIVVRDLKPASLILDGEGRIHIVDFGIAGLQDNQSKARLQGPMGYAPAEQFGSMVGTDVRCDIYSLGATLYTMLTAQVPPWSVDLATGKARLAPPQEHNPKIPLPLADVILNMMALRRSSRYSSVREAGQALNQIKLLCLEGSPEDWLPDPPPRGLSSVVAMGVVQVALLAGVGALVYYKFGPEPVVTPTASPIATHSPVASPTERPTVSQTPRDRSYAELLLTPGDLGFTSSEALYRGLSGAISSSFVRQVAPQQLRSGILVELGNLLSQAGLDQSLLKQLAEGDPLEAYARAQKIFADKLDSNVLGYALMNGLLRGLDDPYSVLLTPAEWSRLEDLTDTGGVGISLGLDRSSRQLTILETLEGSPARQAGILPGDKILTIDKQPSPGMSIEVAQSLIRGLNKSLLVLTIERDGDSQDYSLVRAPLRADRLAGQLLAGKVGYLRLRSFSADTGGQFRQAAAGLKQQGAIGLIIDLRNNGGGFEDGALGVLGALTPSDTLVYYTLDRKGVRTDFRTSQASSADLPVLCLINRFSAGAAEITALALRAHKVAQLVGERSLGKTSLQQLYDLNSEGQIGPRLKLTVARCYGPDDSTADGQGVEPDLVVPLEPRYVGSDEEDVQLKKALEMLTQGPSSSPLP